MSVTHEPPEAVKRTLRKEVAYGCPFCRRPFLTWHHFDPPFEVEQHHRPEGMIALCLDHHARAGAGAYPVSRLRQMKAAAYSTCDVWGASLQEADASFVLRIGGNYVCGCRGVLSIGGRPVVGVKAIEDGLLALSLSLYAPDDSLVATMDENVLSLHGDSAHLWDMKAPPGRRALSVWFGERQIGLELACDRVSLNDLASLMAEDRRRSDQRSAKATQALHASLPAEVRLELEQPPTSSLAWMTGVAALPEPLRSAHLSPDRNAALVAAWATANCLDSEGRLPLVNFRRMALYSHGAPLRVADGQGVGGMWGYNVFTHLASALNLPCPCESCSPRPSGLA